jgi:8-oxo-dGTP pyrophosphatase MutT (NUDIX family)
MRSMELFTAVDQPDVPPKPAATIMVLRQGERAPEVLMMRRHTNSGVLGGAYVFPGGKVDAADSGADAGVLGQSPQALAHALNEPADSEVSASSLFCAAMRETLEECGLLYVQGAQATDIQTAQAALAGGESWLNMVRANDWVMQSQALVPWSRWITPKASLMMNKRFDTRFFIAALPAGQTPQHDGHEATALEWLSAREGLARYDRGEIDLAPPQIMSLVQLGGFDTVDAILAFARSQPVGLIQPHHFIEDGVRVLCYPGDSEHEVKQAVWPGPTRVYHRNARFETKAGSVMALLDGPY